MDGRVIREPGNSIFAAMSLDPVRCPNACKEFEDYKFDERKQKNKIINMINGLSVSEYVDVFCVMYETLKYHYPAIYEMAKSRVREMRKREEVHDVHT